MSTSTSSSSTSSIYSSSSRITSLFSDLDTDSIVKSLCSGQQSKIDKQYQKKTTYQWQEDAWNDISDAVSDLADTYCSTLGSSSMLKSSTYVAYSVSTSDTSGAVKVTAGSSATASTVKVSVQQLAKNATVTGSSGISTSASGGDGLSSSNTAALAKLAFKTPMQFDTQGNISFSINGKTFTFSSDTTLQSMINTVNADSDANVTMKYSRVTDSFTITSDSGGASSKVAIQNISGNAFGTDGAFGIAEGSTANGQNAKVTIDDGTGAGAELEKDSNAFTIDGLTYQLNDTTSSTISFNVERDYSATVDAIEKFVDALNTVITKITSYTGADDNSNDYPPLTEAQKEDMTEEQIEKWEVKAKAGVLRHNSALEALATNLKNAFFSSAGGTGKTAASIGIATTSFFSSNAGQLTVDTDALKEALASTPDLVLNIFTGGSSSVASAQQGVMYKLRNVLNAFDDTADDMVDRLSDKIDSAEDTIDDMEDKLSDMANRYYEKFSNMETALSKLNSSANMISSMFSTT